MARTYKDKPRFVADPKPGKRSTKSRRPSAKAFEDIDPLEEALAEEEPVATSNEVLVTLQDAFDRLSDCFLTMNKYAAGDHLDQWSRVDWQDILGHVYFVLAPVHQNLAAILTTGNTNKAAAAAQENLRRAVAGDLKEKHDAAVKRMTAVHNAQMRDLRAEKKKLEELQEKLRSAEASRIADYAKSLDALEREFDARVEARVEEITSGVPRKGKSGRLVML